MSNISKENAAVLANWLVQNVTADAEVTILATGVAVATCFNEDGEAVRIEARQPINLPEGAMPARDVAETHGGDMKVRALPYRIDFEHPAHLMSWEIIRPEHK